MNTKRIRSIHTHLYTQHAADILESVIGQWSDGAYENSPRMERYWRFANIRRDFDNEALIEVNLDSGLYAESWKGHKWLQNGFHSMSDDEVKQFFAGYIKRIAQMDLKDNNAGSWKRDNMNESSYLNRQDSITFAEIYALYDHLLGRKNRSSVDVIGKPADSQTIAKNQHVQELKNAANEELKSKLELINAEYAKKIADLEQQKTEARNKAHAEWRLKIESIKA